MPRENSLFVLVLAIILITFIYLPPKNNSEETRTLGCTIFTIILEGNIYMGNNEDFYLTGTFIKFQPAINNHFGYVTLGYEDNQHEYDGYAMGGMNDQGLSFDSNGLPAVPLNPKPGQPMAAFHLMESVLKRYATVQEVIEWANTSDWYLGMLASQLHVADAMGNVVVISAGTNGEVAFTQMDGQHYIVSTNFNLANPDNHISGSYPCWRYDTAVQLLANVTTKDMLSVDTLRDILEAVHQEGANPTRYSNVFDLKNRTIYLWHDRDYTSVRTFNLDEELSEGYHKWTIRNLFVSSTPSSSIPTATTTISGSSSYISPFTLLILGLIVIIRKTKDHKSRK